MATRYFHWDTVNDCVMHETDESGNTLVTYTHEPGQSGRLLSENRGGTESYHHYDALGSTTMLTDDSGAVTDTFQYDASGNEVARTGTTETPYRWCGRWGYQYDPLLGGYYIRERSYQPSVARWMSVDPLWFWMTQDPVTQWILQGASLNLYVYAFLSPSRRIDPSGRWPMCFAHDCVNKGPERLVEGLYALRVEVIAQRGENCSHGSGIIQFKLRESHIDPRTGKCQEPAQGELEKFSKSGFPFAYQVSPGCTKPTAAPRKVRGCWVLDFTWKCNLSCPDGVFCGPTDVWAEIYNSALSKYSTHEFLPNDVKVLPNILRVDARIQYDNHCPCLIEECSINQGKGMISWLTWKKQYSFGPPPQDAVDVEPDPMIPGNFWYRTPDHLEKCNEEEQQFIWSL